MKVKLNAKKRHRGSNLPCASYTWSSKRHYQRLSPYDRTPVIRFELVSQDHRVEWGKHGTSIRLGGICFNLLLILWYFILERLNFHIIVATQTLLNYLNPTWAFATPVVKVFFYLVLIVNFHNKLLWNGILNLGLCSKNIIWFHSALGQHAFY